jgi:hypothetical protein
MHKLRQPPVQKKIRPITILSTIAELDESFLHHEQQQSASCLDWLCRVCLVQYENEELARWQSNI